MRRFEFAIWVDFFGSIDVLSPHPSRIIVNCLPSNRFDSDNPLAGCRFCAIIPERLVANRSGIGFSDRCNVALTDHDRRLLERCLNRDSGAWREFVDRFASLFVQVIRHTAEARSIEITPNDVDDLCAEVFLAILSDDFAILRRFKGESALATYFAVISRRIVVREMITRRMAEALGHVKSHAINLEMARADVSDLLRIENQELVERMLEGLPGHDAKVIRQFHMEGRSYREIAADLGIPENSIGPTLSRAREKLRQGLTPSF